MITLIVNADDYGYDRNRTEAILECFRNRIITQTTAMVNMPYCSTAIKLARKGGFANRIGLHLNLTFGFPMTRAIRNYRLFCDEEGRFNGVFHRSTVRRFLLPKAVCRAVEEEVMAQMTAYVNMGLPLMHLDSHHHSHTDPVVLRIVLSLAHQFGFNSIRISRNLPLKRGLLKTMYKNFVNGRIVYGGFYHADFFGGADAVMSAIPYLPDASLVEMMMHPLYSTGKNMPLNMEYDSCNGELCDTATPISQIARRLDEIKGRVKLVIYK